MRTAKTGAPAPTRHWFSFRRLLTAALAGLALTLGAATPALADPPPASGTLTWSIPR
jgi:hypothetical protein